jgi:hypothetical protein
VRFLVAPRSYSEHIHIMNNATQTVSSYGFEVRYNGNLWEVRRAGRIVSTHFAHVDAQAKAKALRGFAVAS